MPRTTLNVSRPGFVADPNSMERTSGRQIDWANVGAGYIDATTGKKVLPGGTVVGTLLGAGLISPRVVTTNPATEILVSNAIEGDPSAAKSGYGTYKGGVVYEALLPDATGSPKTLPGALKTELAAAGCTFKFEKYSDNTAS
jgi:hypothetical protein